MKKRFSIITPVYNAEKYISRCIDSILIQTFNNFELIIVDDGSVDRSLEICSSYAAKDDRILVFSKENRGVSSARNLGLQQATGDFVIFVDSDDTISPNLCERLHYQIEQVNYNDLIIYGYYAISDDFKESVAIQQEITYKKENMADALNFLDKSRLLYIVWNKVFVRSKIKYFFPENMTFAEDSCFVMKYLEQIENIKIITFKGYDYYTNISGSAMKRYHKNMLENCLQEFDFIKDCCVGTKDELFNYAQRHLRDNFWYFLFPSLIKTEDFTKTEKKNELNKIMSNDVLQSVLYSSGFERKIQKIILKLSEIKLYSLMIFLYGRILRV